MSLLLTGQSSGRLKFRKVRQSDFDIWLPFFVDPQTSKHWYTPETTPQQACKDWYQSQFYRYENQLGGMNALIEKVSGDLVGHCGLLVQSVDDQTELEIGYSLLPEYWGRGFATEAARACRDYGFEQNEIESLISIISLTNQPSERVALANGMRKDKLTEYRANAVNIFRINRTEWSMLT